MASVRLSPVFNQAQFVANGELLAGGKIYSFTANSNSVQQTTYTDSSGKIQNSNPIILDSSGRLQSEIWLITDLNYRLVLADSANNIITEHNMVEGLALPSANLYNQSVVFTDNVFYDNNGEPLANGKIFSYLNNSFTKKVLTYTNSSGIQPNPNPITLTANGTLTSNIFLDTNIKYNLVLTKNDGTTILKNYNSCYGVNSAVIPPPQVTSLYFTPNPVIEGEEFFMGWTTANSVAVTWELEEVIGNTLVPFANGSGNLNGTTGNFIAPNTTSLIRGVVTAEGFPGAVPLFSGTDGYLNILTVTNYTTGLYPYMYEEDLALASSNITNGLMLEAINESLSLSRPTIQQGNLLTVVVQYNNYPTETANMALPTIPSGNLSVVTTYVTYNNYATETANMALPTIPNGNLAQTIFPVNYNNYPTETANMALPTITSGTLS